MLHDPGEAGHATPDACSVHTQFSPFPMAMVEGDSYLVRYANPAFCTWIGKAAEVLIGTSIHSCLPQFDECLSLVARVVSTGVGESHTTREGSKSSPSYRSYSVWPVPDEHGLPKGAMILVTESSLFYEQSTAVNEALMVSAVHQHELAEIADLLATQTAVEMAERKKSQEALQASEARLVLALESAKASTWEWDIETNRVRWSNEIRVLGETERTNRDTSYRAWRSLVHPDDRPALDGVACEATKYDVRINIEFRLQRFDGSTTWMLLRGRVGRAESERPINYSGIVLDITERKYAEQALMRSEKLNGVGRLAATLAHEINNPLDAATNAIYIVRTNPEVPKTAHHFLDIADEELRRVAHMTRQSLGLYREATLPTTFGVDTLLDSVLGLLRNRIMAKSVIVERRSGDIPEMTGVFGELRQVFVNLLANSLDALDVGGTIKFRTSVVTPRNGGQRLIRITIADSGKGIGTSQLVHVFEPFFTTKGELGTGLGLWVSKQLVEKHHGKIRVKSATRLGHSGTVFSVTLPDADRRSTQRLT